MGDKTFGKAREVAAAEGEESCGARVFSKLPTMSSKSPLPQPLPVLGVHKATQIPSATPTTWGHQIPLAQLLSSNR